LKDGILLSVSVRRAENVDQGKEHQNVARPGIYPHDALQRAVLDNLD
jgi:hypothetical protein